MLRMRLHGRGGQGTKTCGSIISLAASLEGYYSQDSPMYGPERRGAPVSSFVRISSSPVSERGYIPYPDVVVLFDRTLVELTAVNPLAGLREAGVLIVNGRDGSMPGPVMFFDASHLAKSVLGKDNISAAMAAVACKALNISCLDNTLTSIRTELTEIGLSSPDVEKNLRLGEECYRNTSKLVLAGEEVSPVSEIPLVEVQYRPPVLATAQILATGNSPLRRTGTWRTSRPAIDYSRCTKCMVCFVYCPDSAIALGEDLVPRIDYDNCKGCMVCLTECPPRAISEETG